MTSMSIDIKPQRVANLLKQLINQNCVEGEEWYEDIGEMPTLFDISMAIKLLESADGASLKVVDDEQTDCPWK